MLWRLRCVLALESDGRCGRLFVSLSRRCLCLLLRVVCCVLLWLWLLLSRNFVGRSSSRCSSGTRSRNKSAKSGADIRNKTRTCGCESKELTSWTAN